MATARTALVTGGNRGIGFEVCRQLAQQGLRVLVGARVPASGAEAVARLRADGAEASLLPLDLARPEAVDAALATLARDHIHVDVLVNNAGVYPAGGLLEVSIETLRETMEVNVVGPIELCRALVPAMLRARYGRIVNVSSGLGSFDAGLRGPAAYSLSKASLNALTLVLSHELSGDVKVNSVDPGWVKTRMGGPAPAAAPSRAPRRSCGSRRCPPTARAAASSAIATACPGSRG
jgi:NAD(P)-dependent dehydrogenase (short-subunit alcohol dehydrogenase family)